MNFKNVLVDRLSHTTFLLAFIFCGAIVGENLSLSLIVSSFGPSVLSRMYLVNGILLFSLPLLFFRYIDRVDRGKFLSKLLVSCSLILLCLLLVLAVFERFLPGLTRYILIVLYPFSYLSKTILFLTFWTFANDIFSTEAAKQKFPIIAAWGITGGILGSCIGSMSVRVAPVEMLIGVWAISFWIASFFLNRIKQRYEKELKVHEELHERILFNKKQNTIQQNPSILLLILMSCQYFLVFLSVFSLDYLFWSNCKVWFGTSEAIVSFQFIFYLIHATVTVAGLRLFLPKVIHEIGFTRIFYSMPIVLFAGSVFLILFMVSSPGQSLFFLFTGVQFARYVIFENTYAPIYQMYFAAIEKEKRGRAKILIEGFVKPGTIIVCGLLLIFFEKNEYLILIMIACCGAIGIVNAIYIRRTYARALIPRALTIMEPQTIINEFTGNSDRKFMSLVLKYSSSDDADLRVVAVRLLAVSGSQQAFDELKRIFHAEKDQKVQEAVARSISGFYTYSTRLFLEELLSDTNVRIKANALYALNKMHCNWKRYLLPVVRKLFDERQGIRLQIEAACYLWDNGDSQDRQNAEKFVKSLLYNTNPDRQAAGVYLSGIIKQSHWELELLNKIHSPYVQVYRKALETIFRIDSGQLHMKVLRILEEKERERISVTGKVLELQGVSVWDMIIDFLPKAKNRGMISELIRCIRLLVDDVRLTSKGVQLPEKTKEAIVSCMNTEIKNVYEEVYKWCSCRIHLSKYIDTRIMDEAVMEDVVRFCEWAVNAMVLLDKKGIFTWRYNDIDIRERDQRNHLIEIIEGTSYDGSVSMILPMLKTDSLENLSQYGKAFFNFNDKNGLNGLIYFLNSENEWMSLCAIYTLSKLPEDKWTAELTRAMQRMENDSQDQLVPASTELLQRKFYGSKKNYAVDLLERVLFLKSTALFRNVNSERLMKLAEIVQEVCYDAGEVLSKEGDIAEHLYIIKSGRIKITKSNGEQAVQVSIINSTETYGEIGLFNQAPRSATAIAIEECRLMVIKRSQLKRLLVEVPDIAFNLLEVLSDRLRKSGDNIVELSRKQDIDQGAPLQKLAKDL